MKHAKIACACLLATAVLLEPLAALAAPAAPAGILQAAGAIRLDTEVRYVRRTTVVRRPGGAVRHTTVVRRPVGTVRHTTVVRRPGGVVRRTTVVRGGGVRWVRPGRYWWRPGAAIAAGAAIGFVSATAAAAWAGAAPGPNLCWYYTDPSQRRGFWDACQ
jgi:hypothetical protein